MGLGLFVNLWVVRYLQPEGFGLLSYCLSIIAITGGLANLGIDQYIVRELVRSPEKRGNILGTTIGLRLITGFVAVAISFLTIVLLRPGDALSLQIIAILSLGTIANSLDAFDFFYQSEMRASVTVKNRNFGFVIFSIFRIAFVVFAFSIGWFALTYALEIVVVGFLLWYSFKKRENIPLDFDKIFAKQIFREGFPLLMSHAVVLIYMRIDQILLGEWKGNEEVGIYAAAVRLTELWYIVPQMLTTAVYPALIEAKSKNQEDYHGLLKSMFHVLLWFSLLLSIGTTIISEPLVALFYGEKFQVSANVLAIYIWSSLGTNLGVATGQYIIAENLLKLSFYRTFAAMLVNVGLNVFLIPKYGSIGAAIATLVSYSVAFLWTFTNKQARNQLTLLSDAVFFFKGWRYLYTYARKI